MSFELASNNDTKLLEKVLADEKYQILDSYDIHIQLFTKYGKRDKEGNLKTPALTKNGIAIPAQVKLVSNFNRLTDDIDVKIILNAELWEELSEKERMSTLENMLSYIAIKEDKNGEALTISESCDKVQLKLRHPDFYCEGFLNLIEKYGNSYGPLQDAQAIADNNTESTNNIKEEKIENDKSTLDLINDVLEN